MTDNEFQTLLLRMDEGFTVVYRKIDNLNNEFIIHKEVCFTRFADIEKQQAIQNALNCQEKIEEKERRDYWKYFIRSAMVIITGGMLGIIWKLFVVNIDIIK